MAYVLIVDDDEDFAEAAASEIKDAGHEVAIQLDTEEAVVAMKQRRPDLLVLDVMFPEDSSAGFELARRLQAPDSELRGLPILMLTAINAKLPLGFGPDDIDDSWLPVADFLEKPVDFDLLREKVDTLLRKAAEA
jgi:CheY-like chemotaxis protein